MIDNITSAPNARRTQMSDGRYLIYFTFDDAPITTENPGTKPEARAQPVASDSEPTREAMKLSDAIQDETTRTEKR